MKTLKVGIASYEAMKARTLAIASGELKPRASDPKVWFNSHESFARLRSSKNRRCRPSRDIVALRRQTLRKTAR